MTLNIAFDNSYARLPERLYVRQRATPVRAPQLIALNDDLARRLGLEPGELRSPEGIAFLSGNAVPEGAEPLAQAYAGHQFGGWVPQLGDGRALLVGEVVAPDGARLDIQLKGSGPTPFSRRGDGRAWLGPVLREYVVSEAMAALGVPTTRALAALSTGETVWRETGLPGAILVRVASSHIRVGTFQYFAARGDTEALRLLTDHVICRHYPDADGPLQLIVAVAEAQARLIARWMALGFIHGVMNTDNMAVSGETIDYGPCAFMDVYHPERVFSSIDQFGRYAYGNQPQIALWNLAQFASALLPLLGPEDQAIKDATEAINRFTPVYQSEWLRLFGAKIGLENPEPDDAALIGDLLSIMAAQEADFTRVFHGLGHDTAAGEFRDPAPFHEWRRRWRARLARQGADPMAIMRASNPAIIPRNHRIEQAIKAALEGDFAPFHRLCEATRRPYAPHEEDHDLMAAPQPDEIVRRTFCGT
ncbi:uncharacterized protein YdiU (UPF0061 family) [Albidovulum inexpectatum]|uniref:Protein nucleotidyltransferase YdiU n=1 Tax=Albidovulum inexpectatum TaxID=196587 RepID=A0A2S5JJJ4_9RHOB|nr:YdiU family protein [Albidovulum inexpectatum]PPB81630.1 uncharacterized protein YdiU (UPF0061 family) [Albidovulum inexpectatum]